MVSDEMAGNTPANETQSGTTDDIIASGAAIQGRARDARRPARTPLHRALIWMTVAVGLVFAVTAVLVIVATLDRQARPQTALERELSVLKTAVARNPESADAHVDYGAALYESGQEDQGIEQMEIALKIQPNNYAALYNLAVVHWAQGKRDKAIEELRDLAARGPRRIETWFKLGAYLQEMERWEDAIEAYEAVLELTTGDVAVRYRIGVCEEELGDTDAAVEMYESTFRFVPDYEPALEALERLGER